MLCKCYEPINHYWILKHLNVTRRLKNAVFIPAVLYITRNLKDGCPKTLANICKIKKIKTFSLPFCNLGEVTL